MSSRAHEWFRQAERDLDHAEGAPFEHYGPLQSREAIAYAREIIGLGRLHLA